jgi:hypothetical protein
MNTEANKNEIYTSPTYLAFRVGATDDSQAVLLITSLILKIHESNFENGTLDIVCFVSESTMAPPIG